MSEEKKISIKSPRNRYTDAILNWNKKHPVDYWWRTKYGIPFGSKEHLGMSFVSMYMEFLEEKLVDEWNERKENEQEKYENDLVGLKTGEKAIPMSDEEIDNAFDNMDMTQFLDDPNS